MIIVRLMGGLGNQLFQYAAGRSLAAATGTDIALDLSFLKTVRKSEDFTPRDYALSAFNIDTRVYSDFEAEVLKKSNPILGKVNRYLSGYTTFYDYDMAYKPSFFDQGKRVILEGYFQCEEYFTGISGVLEKELTLKVPVITDHELEKVRQVESVGIHVRRGDYSTTKTGMDYHGTCDIAYYEKAVEHMQRTLNAPKFFIFSDDIKWVKDNLKTSTVFEPVENKGREAFLKDFEMLRNCRHQVIANSTFSWWAAWLNTYPGKQVVAPAKWFKDPAKKNDIVPQNWIKL